MKPSTTSKNKTCNYLDKLVSSYVTILSSGIRFHGKYSFAFQWVYHFTTSRHALHNTGIVCQALSKRLQPHGHCNNRTVQIGGPMSSREDCVPCANRVSEFICDDDEPNYENTTQPNINKCLH